MNTGKRNTARKVLCLVLAVLILGSLVSGALIMTVGAASSKEIEKELVALREERCKRPSTKIRRKRRRSLKRRRTSTSRWRCPDRRSKI